MNRAICALTDAVSTLWAIVLLPLAFYALRYLGASDTELTFNLSVLALSFSQLVLRAGTVDTRAMQRKLDEMIRA